MKHTLRERTRILIKTVNGDAVLIAIAIFHQLVSLNKFCIEFGEAKSLRFMPLHYQGIARNVFLTRGHTWMILLHSKTCSTNETNKASWILFSKDNKVLDNFPLTKKPLRQHVPRTTLQCSKWRQFSCKDFDDRDACQWGWQKVKTNWYRYGLTCHSLSSRELVKFGCKKGCTEWYIFLTSELKCT